MIRKIYAKINKPATVNDTTTHSLSVSFTMFLFFLFFIEIFFVIDDAAAVFLIVAIG